MRRADPIPEIGPDFLTYEDLLTLNVEAMRRETLVKVRLHGLQDWAREVSQ